MHELLARLSRIQFARFLLSGGFNTALTYALYLALLQVASYQLSYAIAYITGVALSYFLNRFFVFKSHRGAQSLLLLPLPYIVQYLMSAAILWIWVSWLGQRPEIAPLIAIIVTLPATFALSKIAFMKRNTS